MTESLFSTTTTTDSVELLPLIICILVAVLLGLALAGVYCVRNRHTRSFVVTLAVLPAIVCAVIALVNGNVGNRRRRGGHLLAHALQERPRLGARHRLRVPGHVCGPGLRHGLPCRGRHHHDTPWRNLPHLPALRLRIRQRSPA